MKKIMILSFLISISVAQQLTAAGKKPSDTNVFGHVIDNATGEHLSYINITVKGTTVGTSTDATGHFNLKNLTPGTFTIEASSVGYRTQSKEVLLIAGKSIEVNFMLEEDAVLLDNIVVSANRNETRRQLTSGIVNVLNPKKFESTNAVCLADGLNYQSGLRVESNCQNCGFPQVRINGLEGPYSQILIDSRAISSALAGVYGLEQIPVNMVERVEVVRGGGSATFGSNAVAGVINIITKEPKNNSLTISNTSAWVGGSAYDINTSVNGTIVSNNNKAGVTLFATARQRSSYDADKDGFSELGKLNGKNIGFRGFYRTSNNTKLTLEYHTIDEFRRGGNSFNKPPHEADIAEQTEHNIHSVGLKYDWFIKGGKHWLQFYSSLQHIDRNSYYGSGKDPNAYGSTVDLSNVNGIQYVFDMDKFLFMPAKLTAGSEFSYNSLNDEMLGYNRTIKQKVNMYSFYLQNEWSKQKFSLLIGFRMDKHNLIKSPIASPRLNVRYTPLKWMALRVGYSSGFRAPQAYDEDLHVTAVGGGVSLISIDPNLKTERSHSINASVNFTHTVGQCAFDFLIEGFYTDLSNVFFLEEIGKDAQGNLKLERRNGKGSMVGGINFEGNIIPLKTLRFQLGFTYQQSLYKEAEKWSQNVAAQKKMFRSPDTYGFMTATYEPIKNFNISFSGTYTGSMLVQHLAGFIPADKEEKTNPFFDLNLKLSYDIKLKENITMQINGGMKNILNSYQKDFDQGALRDAGYIYGPSQPRTAFLGLKFML